MKKKSKAGIIAATVLGVLCVAMIALCIVLFLSGAVGKVSEKEISDTKSDFTETEENTGNDEYTGTAEGFEVVANPVDSSGEEGASEEEGTSEEETGDYLCPESNQRELTEEDVAALQSQTVEGLPADKNIIQMVINEMYARRGYQFGDEAVQAYFDSKTWYQEITDRTDDMETVQAEMSDIEKANIDFLSTYVQ